MAADDDNPWDAASLEQANSAAQASQGGTDDDGEPAWTRAAFGMNGASSSAAAAAATNPARGGGVTSNPAAANAWQQQRARPEEEQDEDPYPLGLKRFRRFLLALHIIDAILATTVLSCHFILNPKDQVHIVLLCTWCGLLLLRFITAVTHSKCGWMASGYISLFTASAYLLMTLVAWFVPRRRLYRSLSHLVNMVFVKAGTHPTNPFDNHTPKRFVLLLIFAGLAVWECIRWALIHKYLVLDYEYYIEAEATSMNIGNAQSMNQRPWWWNKPPGAPRDSTMEEALLGGNQATTRNGHRGDTSNGNMPTHSPVRWFSFRVVHNDRDDVSVDFASLNEDWASRSVDDPLWWSRDGGGAAD